jgi:hypothetical protein
MVNGVSTTQEINAKLHTNSTPAQPDVLKAYLMERRRALLTELRSIDKVLGIEAQPKTR